MPRTLAPAPITDAQLRQARAVIDYALHSMSLPSHIDRDDLRQAALEAVLRQHHRYTPALGSYTTFIDRRIKGAIRDQLRVDRPGSDRHGEVTIGRGIEGLRVKVDLVSGDQRVAPNREHDHSPRLMDTIATPANVHDDQDFDVAPILDAAISRLPTTEQFTIRGRYYGGLNLREIGEVLGLTESRVSQLHQQACESLARNAAVRALAA